MIFSRTPLLLSLSFGLAACAPDSASVVSRAPVPEGRLLTATEEATLRTNDAFDEAFEAAGLEFNVPPAVLKALAYSLTRYQMVNSQDEFEGRPRIIGLMGLPAPHLEQAARLATLSVEAATSTPRENIRAAAAWLSHLAERQSLNRQSLLAWEAVLGEYSATSDERSRQAFVQGEVFSTLKLGVGRLTQELEHTGQLAELDSAVGEYAEVTQALERAPDYGAAVWRPSPNFNSRGLSTPQLVVIHSCEGSYASCWGWLANPAAQASAHYVVNAAGTEIAQLVKESERAWHVSATYSCANNSEQRCDLDGQRTNDFAVGIEHAGFASQSGWAEAQLEASARLVCNVTNAWNIAKDRYHIVAHQQLQPWNRNDPGPNWPWSAYLNRINALCGTGVTPQNLIIDSNNGNNDLNWGYVQVSASWKSSDNVAGYYGSGYWYADTAPVGDSAAFFFKAETDGERTIDAWWTAGLDRSEAATFSAFNAANQRVGSTSVDQTQNGGQWNELGRVRFTRGWNKITLSRWQAPGRVVVADAIRIR